MPRAKITPIKKAPASAKTAQASRKPAATAKTAKSSKTLVSKPPRTMKQTGADAFASSRHLLHAGLSALSLPRLPRAESAVAGGLSKIADSFGFKKLEDVFDQRVASALQRIGIPSARELARLVEKVDTLSALVKSTKTKTRK